MPKHQAKNNPSYLLIAALIGGATLVYYLSTRKENIKPSPLPVRPKPQIYNVDFDEENIDIPEIESPIPSTDPLDAELVQNVSSWILRQPNSIVTGLPKPTIDGAEWVNETTVVEMANGRSIEIVRGKDRVVFLNSYIDGPITVYYKSTGEIVPYN